MTARQQEIRERSRAALKRHILRLVTYAFPGDPLKAFELFEREQVRLIDTPQLCRYQAWGALG